MFWQVFLFTAIPSLEIRTRVAKKIEELLRILSDGNSKGKKDLVSLNGFPS